VLAATRQQLLLRCAWSAGSIVFCIQVVRAVASLTLGAQTVYAAIAWQVVPQTRNSLKSDHAAQGAVCVPGAGCPHQAVVIGSRRVQRRRAQQQVLCKCHHVLVLQPPKLIRRQRSHLHTPQRSLRARRSVLMPWHSSASCTACYLAEDHIRWPARSVC
jgi:hypothetical protein